MLQEELQFPVEWHYKIICYKDDAAAGDEIIKVLRRNGFDAIPEVGAESSGGKYSSWRVSLTFNDRESLRGLSEQLNALPCVKYLI